MLGKDKKIIGFLLEVHETNFCLYSSGRCFLFDPVVKHYLQVSPADY